MVGLKKSFSTFSVRDLSIAEEFYSETLQLEISKNEMGLLELHLPKNSVLIYEKKEHVPAEFTILNFRVKELEKTVDDLIEKGVQFEKYGPPIKTNAKGIHKGSQGPAIAWFKDPSGNILSVLED